MNRQNAIDLEREKYCAPNYELLIFETSGVLTPSTEEKPIPEQDD